MYIEREAKQLTSVNNLIELTFILFIHFVDLHKMYIEREGKQLTCINNLIELLVTAIFGFSVSLSVSVCVCACLIGTLLSK